MKKNNSTAALHFGVDIQLAREWRKKENISKLPHKKKTMRNKSVQFPTLLEKFRNVPGNFWATNVPNFYQ